MGFGSESRSLSEEIVQKEVAARGKTLVVPFTYWDYANHQIALKQGPKAGL
jgi:hypothetical protein